LRGEGGGGGMKRFTPQSPGISCLALFNHNLGQCIFAGELKNVYYT